MRNGVMNSLQYFNKAKWYDDEEKKQIHICF